MLNLRIRLPLPSSWSIPSTAAARRYASTTSSSSTSSSLLPQNIYDIVIVGGGMVGSALACALATKVPGKHLSMAVLETVPVNKVIQTSLSTIPDLRVSSIIPASQGLLQEVGAWDKMKQKRVTPFYDMQVWDAEGSGSMHFSTQESARYVETLTPSEQLSFYRNTQETQQRIPPLGHIVENNIVQSALMERLLELAANPSNKIHIAAPSSLANMNLPSSISPNESDFAQLQVKHADGSVQDISARLVIGADGANSRVRHLSGIGASGADYNQKGVVATIKTSQPHSTAWQRFLPTGPVAVLPCHDSYSSIVWSTNLAHADHLLSLSPQDFVKELNHVLHAPPSEVSPAFNVVPRIFRQPLPESLSSLLPVLFPSHTSRSAPHVTELVDKPGAFPLRLIHAAHYAKHRVALIGDAAHVVHPLAGQGVNLGFGDVMSLSKILHHAHMTGSDLGSLGVLQHYEQERRPINDTMILALNAIWHIYHAQGPLAAARNIGMDAINSIPGLKHQIVEHAMGLRPALPPVLHAFASHLTKLSHP